VRSLHPAAGDQLDLGWIWAVDIIAQHYTYCRSVDALPHMYILSSSLTAPSCVRQEAPILLCDEATSALDSKTERDILEALQQLAAGRTSLFVAHRLSTAAQADKIVVLDQVRRLHCPFRSLRPLIFHVSSVLAVTLTDRHHTACSDLFAEEPCSTPIETASTMLVSTQQDALWTTVRRVHNVLLQTAS
jgi:energy-coupling factor transporter ATP-binding protein EcfA2